MVPSRRIRFTLLACAVSGVVSAFGSNVESSSGSFLSQPLLYLPGLVFGYCFARTNLEGPLRALLFTAGSGLIYYGAIRTYMALVHTDSGSSSFVASVLPGLVGGLGLSLLTKLLTRARPAMFDEGLTAVVGAGMGFIFTMLFGIQPQILGMVLAFTAWQVPVGLLLSANLERQREAAAATPA